MKSHLEIVIAVALVLSLVVMQLGRAADPETLLALSAGLIAVGLAIGVPAGLIYHLLLARGLRAAGADARRWWLRPTGFHAALAPADVRRLLPWFRVGAAGFLVVVIGCVFLLLLALAVTRS